MNLCHHPTPPLVEYWIGREVGVTASSFGLLCNWIRSRNTRVSQASKRSEPRCAASLRVIPRPTKRTSEGNEQCPPNLDIHFGQKNAAVKETFMFSSHLRPRSVRQSSSIYKFSSGKFMRHLRWLHDHARQRANLDNLDKIERRYLQRDMPSINVFHVGSMSSRKEIISVLQSSFPVAAPAKVLIDMRSKFHVDFSLAHSCTHSCTLFSSAMGFCTAMKIPLGCRFIGSNLQYPQVAAFQLHIHLRNDTKSIDAKRCSGVTTSK